MDIVAYSMPKAPAIKRHTRREQKMTAHKDVSTLKYVETRASLGDELRAARSARGLSVADVETDLRIKAYYIDAIEAGDRSALPDKVYVDGFVRNYASYLQLNPDDTLARFDEETGFANTPRKSFNRSRKSSASTATAQNPLAGYTPPRRSESGSGSGVGRSLVSLWPLVVLAGLGYAIWFGVNAAREAGIIPDNLSVIGATDSEPPVFTANISDESINGGTGDDTIERPADLSYAKLGTPPYWTLPEDERSADGPVSTIDVATVGLFSAHKGMIGGSALVRSAAPLDLTPAAPVIGADIAAETRAALLDEPGTTTVDVIAADAQPTTGRDFALVALEETWIEVKAPSGRVRFSGILAPEQAFDVPAGEDLVLKVGNAGGLVVEIGGERFGPFGNRGAVMRNIPITRTALTDRFAPRLASGIAD